MLTDISIKISPELEKVLSEKKYEAGTKNAFELHQTILFAYLLDCESSEFSIRFPWLKFSEDHINELYKLFKKANRMSVIIRLSGDNEVGSSIEIFNLGSQNPIFVVEAFFKENGEISKCIVL